MRHRMKGRKLGRNATHRKAMFRNMATSLIRTLRFEPGEVGAPKVPGRIVTTVAKAKELRPIVEKLITIGKKGRAIEQAAQQYATTAERGSAEWRAWRESDRWNAWNQAVAPAVALRRRAFAKLRDNEAVDILFNELAERFEDRDGGYTRVVRLAKVRLGDAGEQALIEFVGERDRSRRKAKAPVVRAEGESAATASAAPSSTEPAAETSSDSAPAEEAASEDAPSAETASGEEQSEQK